MTTQATIFTAFYACFILDLLLLFKPLKKQFREDVKNFLIDARGNFKTVLSAMNTERGLTGLLELLRKRVSQSVIDGQPLT